MNMILTTRKSFLASAIFVSLNIGAVNAAQLCGEKTLPRQGEVPANQTQCITDYGHYFYVTVPYDNSDVTIATSGGTFTGSDATIILYDGDGWSGDEQLRSANAGTNDETISFVSHAGKRHFAINGNIAQTSLLVTISGGDVPPPMGDYIVFDTNINATITSPAISSKSQYGAIIPTILTAVYADFKGLASAANDPLSDVTNAVHYLASADNISDPDLNQLLYFLGSYKFHASAMTADEAQALSNAFIAVAKMSDFLTDKGGVIQEGFAKALNNFERGAGAKHYQDLLPHALAALQYHSLQRNPFAANNAGDATMALLSALGSAAYYGDAATKTAFNNRMLDVLSVLRSFAHLGETAVDLRWTTEADRKWIVPHSFIALGKIASIASDEAKARFDSTVREAQTTLQNSLSLETIETITTKNYLESAGRQCAEGDALFGHCIVPPKESDILTVSHQCNEFITIRAQSSISQATLAQSCTDMATQESIFHSFFNTQGSPVTGDKNAHLEVIAFASPDEYKKYAPEFYGIDTDNGGMYLEGTPENEGNQARFIAMQCPDDWVGGSCQYEDQIYNLRHEYVHYLDGRYIKTGSFGYFDYNVSWSEGMAEYMANGDDHPRTLASLKGQVIPPLYNLLFMAYGYDELYPWSYFAMRYLAEEHNDDIHLLTAAMRAGNQANYVSMLKAVAERTQAGFEAFVLANSQAVAAKAETLPAPDSIGSCDLAQQYVRKVDAAKTNFSISNTTNTPISLFWLNNNTGKANFAKNYKTLNQGDSYIGTNWSEADRLMLTDGNLNCIGIAVMGSQNNTFTVDENLVKDVVPETLPAQDQMGSCALVQPHVIKDTSHGFSITNTSDTAVRLFRIDNLTGKPMYASAATGFDFGYGTLAQGETYSSDIWYGNRRIMVTDARLNCLSVGVLNNETANFTIDQNMVATAEPAEIIPAANTLGSCDLMQKHLTGPFEADFAFINTSDTAVRVYRVDNETGELSESFGFKTLNKGDTYDSATSWKWFGNRRAAVTTETGQCLAVAVMSEENSVNRYEISNEIVGGTSPLDSDGDGVIDAQDAFPFDPTETKDSDGDGVGDNGDAFPFDASESKDSDGDGYGDNSDAFPNDASEWLDSDGDGQGDNSDPYPNDPDNGGGTVSNCGQATISSGRLTLGDTECVTGGRGSFYVWIENDNTGLVITTAGGEGDVGIYFNADTWATQSNAQAQSGGSGTTKTLAVIANRGWRYISLDTSGQYQGVSLTVTEGQADGGNNGGGTEPPVDSAISNACASQSLFTYGAVESGKAICTGQGHNSYYIYFTGNESEVTIQTAHGAGEVKLYSDVNWANANQYQHKSTTAGTTVQSITVNNPSVGWYYITADTTGSNVALQVDVK
ncbi:collagenase [Pseudoalteromonas tunicata]|jgi:hypothetical protein|uniref:Collagenase family protein n=2 Tax=Pseudoalteromonas tunicata TaxID=314281 RepID=A4C5F5_9GAMM|nr:collagenase [Pseudoalteromonas tunicata]EAR30787.1 Collagenase family protein [Pseudoalteromonas tunicata D2]